MSISGALRTMLRWAARMAAVFIFVLAGLIVADALHKRRCHETYRGEVVEFRGERLTFLNTGHETNGDVLEIDVLYKPSAEDNESHWHDVHVHPQQEERFEIISGTARFQLADREQTLTAGQRITIPRSVPHSWASTTGDEVHMRAADSIDPRLQILSQKGKKGYHRFPESGSIHNCLQFFLG